MLKKSYVDICSFSYECNDALGLICPSVTGKCNCPNSSTTIFCECKRDQNNEYYWDGKSCQLTKLYGEPCSNTATSYMCQTLTQGTICSVTSGTTYLCQCSGLKYFDPWLNKCINQVSINQSCNSSVSNICLSNTGLSCIQDACRY